MQGRGYRILLRSFHFRVHNVQRSHRQHFTFSCIYNGSYVLKIYRRLANQLLVCFCPRGAIEPLRTARRVTPRRRLRARAPISGPAAPESRANLPVSPSLLARRLRLSDRCLHDVCPPRRNPTRVRLETIYTYMHITCCEPAFCSRTLCGSRATR
jgi:hypothetical protein